MSALQERVVDVAALGHVAIAQPPLLRYVGSDLNSLESEVVQPEADERESQRSSRSSAPPSCSAVATAAAGSPAGGK
jgi:hypothetical protein